MGEVADGPVPSAFVAVTVNVYAVPFTNPVTVIGEPGPEAVKPPGLAVTVYCVIGSPPLLVGAAKLTTALPLPGMADTEVGAPGGPVGVTGEDGAEYGPVPTAFLAATVNV